MAAPNLIENSHYYSAGTESSFNVTTVSVSVDNLMIVLIVKDDGDVPIDVWPTGWTNNGASGDNTNAVRVELWYKFADISDVGSNTYTFGGDSEEYIAHLLVYDEAGGVNSAIINTQYTNHNYTYMPSVILTENQAYVSAFGTDDGDSGGYEAEGTQAPPILSQGETSGGGSGSVGGGCAVGDYDSTGGGTMNWIARFIDSGQSSEWISGAFTIDEWVRPQETRTLDVDLTSASSQLSALITTGSNLISVDVDLVSAASSLSIDISQIHVSPINIGLVSSVSELFITNIDPLKYNSALLSYSIEAMEGIEQNKTIFNAYINGIAFPLIGFSLRLQSTANTNTGVKTFDGIIVATTKAEIDLIQSFIGLNLTIDVVYTFRSSQTVTTNIFNGTLNKATKSSSNSIMTMTITGSQDYVTSQNKTHYRNDVIFKSDGSMRLPMDLQLLTGDYIDSDYGLMRVNNLTHYIYPGTSPKTELSIK